MSNVQWKEFNVGEFFEFKSVSPQVTKKDVDMMEDGEIPFIMQSSDNNGVVKYVAKQENEKFKLIDGNVITCFNHLNKVYYQSQSFYSKQGGNVFFITYEGVNELNAKYIVGILNVLIKDVGYGQNTQTNFKKINMILPVTPTGEPDWSYMEDYIRDKQEQVKLRLDQLTSINETPKTLVYSALNRGVGVSHNIEWAEFTVEELFNKVEFNKTNYKVTTQPKVSDEINKVPAITASGFNKGVGCYVPHKDEITIGKNMITISANGAGTGSTFYQEDEFTILQDSYAIITKDVTLNRYLGLYLASILNKYLTSTYDYGNKSTWNKVKTETISLPSYRVLDEDNKYINKPHWDYMEAYIREKQQQVKLRLEQLTSINETPKTLVYSALNRRG